MTAVPKPGRPRKTGAVEVFSDGRECCRNTPKGCEEYERRTLFMYHRDKMLCCLCGRFIPLGLLTFEHKRSRGVGGGFRDDRVELNGVSHFLGNRTKGSMSYELYMQKPLAERIRNCG